MVSKEQVLKHLDELETKLGGRIRELEDELKRWKGAAHLLEEQVNGLKRLEPFKAAHDSLVDIIEPVVNDVLKSHQLTADHGIENITLQHSVKEIHHEVKPEKVVITTETNRGKILCLAAKGFLKDWKTAPDVIDELEKHGWGMSRKVVMMELANLAKKGYLGRTMREDHFVYKVPDEGVVFVGGSNV